jgi:hypothetical protein
MSLRQKRYQFLRLCHFLPLEARELSTLRRNTPTLKLIIKERRCRWERFKKIAARKTAYGRWKEGQLMVKWFKNLSRMYTKKGWRVKEGPKGRQQPMVKGSPNPWALFRDADRRIGDGGSKRYVSPWHPKRINPNRTTLDKVILLVQKASREGHPPSVGQLKQLIDDLSEQIKNATGLRQRQLVQQRNCAERILGGSNE